MKRRTLIWFVWLSSLPVMLLAQDVMEKPKPHPIDPLKCKIVTFLGGVNDDFSVADGATAEPANTVPGGPPQWANSFFDQTSTNKPFAHHFDKRVPKGKCVCEAKLEVKLKPLGEQFTNDRIYLYAPFPNPAWVADLSSISTPWAPGTPVVLNLDLAALPPGVQGTTTTNLLSAIQSSGVLDLVVQDDTSVDYAKLTVKVCPCPCPNKLGGASPVTAEEPMVPHHLSPFGGVENPGGVIQPEEMMKEPPKSLIHKNH